LRAIHTVTLVLCGSEDVATPPDAMRAMAAALPNARFDRIERAGHLSCVEQSSRLAILIRDFLQELSYAR